MSRWRKGLLSKARSAINFWGACGAVGACPLALPPPCRESSPTASPPPGMPSPGMLQSAVPAPSTRTIHFAPPLLVLPTLAPLFGRGEAAIGETLTRADLLLVVELGQKRPPQLQEHPRFLLEAAPTGGGAAIPRGSSLQGAPVQRIHRMPSKHLRSSARGRPPLGCGLGNGKWTRIFCHCSSVQCLQAMPPAYQRPESVLK